MVRLNSSVSHHDVSVFILAVFDMTGVRFLWATLSREQKNQVILLADLTLNVSGSDFILQVHYI